MTADLPRKKLGRTAVEVTRLGLGTAPLGGLYAPVADADAEATIAAAWDQGIRYFDTAPLYGFGLSERRLGAFLRGQPRGEFVISTKVGRLLRRPQGEPAPDPYYKGTPPERPVFDFSHDGVMRSVAESLQRLGLDRVDILLIHDPDDHHDQAIAGAYRALARLRAEGAIGAIGAGMNQSAMLARFAGEGDFDGFLLAGRYTLLDQSAQADLMPVCVERDIGVIIGGVYNSGVIADPAGNAKFNYRAAPDAVIEKLHRIEAVCRRHDVPVKAAALRFAASHPAVTTVLTGARSPAEVSENVAMFRHPVPDALWQDLRSEGLIEPAAPLPGAPP